MERRGRSLEVVSSIQDSRASTTVVVVVPGYWLQQAYLLLYYVLDSEHSVLMAAEIGKIVPIVTIVT